MRRFWTLLALAALVEGLLLYLTPPSLFQGVDYLFLHSINREYLVRAWAEWRLPLWNPHVGLGRPFLSDIETAGFYPPTLLHLALGVRGGVVALVLLHQVLGVVATGALCRALGLSRAVSAFVALAFMAGAPVVGHLQAGQLPYGLAAAYLPLGLLLALRLQEAPSWPRVARLGLALALQLLCGHPQIAWITWLGIGAFLLGRRLERPWGSSLRLAVQDMGRFGLALGWALALAAVQLLPFWELSRQGNRVRTSPAFAGFGAMTASSWVSLLAPMYDGRKFGWEINQYSGVVLVVAGVCGLALVPGRDVRGLALMAALGVLVAIGPATPVFTMLYWVVPGLSSFRLHSRAAILVCAALALGAGFFLTADPRGRAWKAWIVGTTLAAAALAVWWYGFAKALPARPSFTALRVSLTLAAGALLLLWHRAPKRARAVVGLALVTLAAVDLGLATARLKWEYARPGAFPNEALLARAVQQAGLLDPRGIPPRVSVPLSVARPNAGMLHGYSTYMGYVALSLDRVWSYLHATQGVAPSEEQNTYPAPLIPLRAPFPYDTMNLRLGFDGRTGNFVVNGGPDPRAYVVHVARAVEDWGAALSLIRSGHDVRRAALLEGGPPLAGGAGADAGAGGTAEIRAFAAERIVVDVETPRPGYLILAEAWYPGWRARVNGAEAPCLPANVWMRAVPVPSGPSEVVLSFTSTQLLPGALVSLLAGVAVTAALVPWRRGESPERPRGGSGNIW